MCRDFTYFPVLDHLDPMPHTVMDNSPSASLHGKKTSDLTNGAPEPSRSSYFRADDDVEGFRKSFSSSDTSSIAESLFANGRSSYESATSTEDVNATAAPVKTDCPHNPQPVAASMVFELAKRPVSCLSEPPARLPPSELGQLRRAQSHFREPKISSLVRSQSVRPLPRPPPAAAVAIQIRRLPTPPPSPAYSTISFRSSTSTICSSAPGRPLRPLPKIPSQTDNAALSVKSPDSLSVPSRDVQRVTVSSLLLPEDGKLEPEVMNPDTLSRRKSQTSIIPDTDELVRLMDEIEHDVPTTPIPQLDLEEVYREFYEETKSITETDVSTLPSSSRRSTRWEFPAPPGMPSSESRRTPMLLEPPSAPSKQQNSMPATGAPVSRQLSTSLELKKSRSRRRSIKPTSYATVEAPHLAPALPPTSTPPCVEEFTLTRALTHSRSSRRPRNPDTPRLPKLATRISTTVMIRRLNRMTLTDPRSPVGARMASLFDVALQAQAGDGTPQGLVAAPVPAAVPLRAEGEASAGERGVSAGAASPQPPLGDRDPRPRIPLRGPPRDAAALVDFAGSRAGSVRRKRPLTGSGWFTRATVGTTTAPLRPRSRPASKLGAQQMLPIGVGRPRGDRGSVLSVVA